MLTPASTISMHTGRKTRKGKPMDNNVKKYLNDINESKKKISECINEQLLHIRALKTEDTDKVTVDMIESECDELLAIPIGLDSSFVLEYMQFLYDQEKFEKGIEVGEKLMAYYKYNGRPDNGGVIDEEYAALKLAIGRLGHQAGYYYWPYAEACMESALNVFRVLAKKDPATYNERLDLCLKSLSSLHDDMLEEYHRQEKACW